MDPSQLATVAEASADSGAAVAAETFRTDLAVERKDGKTDLVTVADREAQRAVVERIERSCPADTIYGEEEWTETSVPENGRAWVIDPIDGTNNYVRGNRRWTTSVACLADGKPVAAANVLPAMDDRYVATSEGVRRNGTRVAVSDRSVPDRFTVVPTIWWDFDRRDEFAAAADAIVRRFGDLQRMGSAQAALSLLAAGGIGGVITNVDANPWDTIAGAAMVEWAGGTVTDLRGEPWSHDARGLVASNDRAHDLVVDAARELDAARRD